MKVQEKEPLSPQSKKKPDLPAFAFYKTHSRLSTSFGVNRYQSVFYQKIRFSVPE